MRLAISVGCAASRGPAAAELSSQEGRPTPLKAQEVAQEILSQPDYRRDTGLWKSWKGKVIDWLNEVFGGFFGEAADAWFVSITIISVLLLVVLLALVFRLMVSGRSPRRASELTRSAVAKARAAELRLQAGAARESGDLLLALRLYFFALVVGLGERGDLHYRAGWTNRELLQRGEPTPEVAAALNPLVGELDAMSFGGVLVEDGDVDRFEHLCHQWLGEPQADVRAKKQAVQG